MYNHGPFNGTINIECGLFNIFAVSASVIIEQKKDYSVGFVLCRFLFMPERFFSPSLKFRNVDIKKNYDKKKELAISQDHFECIIINFIIMIALALQLVPFRA